MPSGARVEAQRDSNWGLNIYFFAPPGLKGNIEGLCGSYDDNPSNDLYPMGESGITDDRVDYPVNFIQSYR